MNKIVAKILNNKEKTLKYALGGLVILLIIFGIMVFNAIDKVGNYKVNKPYEDLTFVEKTAALIKGYHFDTRKELEDNGLIGTAKNSSSNTNSKSGDILTDEQKRILTKKYEDLNDVQRTLTLEEIDKKYNIISDSDKKNVDRLKKEKEEYLNKSSKEREANKDEYDKLKQEIETNFPNMKYDMITGINKEKTLTINVQLLDNLNMTKSKCEELMLNKETQLKDIGISKILFTVKNKKSEFQGTYLYILESGKYKFDSSTF